MEKWDASYPEKVRLRSGAGIPNHPDWPVLIYRNLLEFQGVSPGVQEVRGVMAGHEWGGFWRWSVYGFHHYHSNAHETLVCLKGNARLLLGGAEGVFIEMSHGDSLILPAGTGHCLVESGPGFEVIGAYPKGQTDYDLRREYELEMDIAFSRICSVPKPLADPFFGVDGPLVESWIEYCD